MIGKRLVVALALLLAAATCASAGPILDEILNYMFMDQSVPMKHGARLFDVQRKINLTPDTSVGQTFVTGPETERIVRVRASLLPDWDWQIGEGAELVLWDSPDKKVSHGRYTIWYQYRGFNFKQAEWEVNARVKPKTSYYFEIGYVGEGDGKMSPIGVMNGADGYKNGQGYLAGKEADFDVCFQIHSKRAPDRVANLKRAFARFDLERPELAAVKQAVEAERFEEAISETVAYFEARQEPVPIVDPACVPKYKPDFDTTAGDLAMQNYFQTSRVGEGYAGPDINWRAQVEFDERGVMKASNYGLNRFGPRGTLTFAYLATGNEKYAKKLNDMFIDWYIDNPPPPESNIGGNPWDTVWASLNTGIRIGHGFIAYSRLHASPFFTTDCRFAYILGLADHCDTLVMVGGDAKGNWCFTQNGSLVTFALNFPEYTNCAKWFETASDRIQARLEADWLPDGVEMESSPGYQRFAYRPLASILELMRERNVTAPFVDELTGALETQAEYFIYLTEPNGLTPTFGDGGVNHERVALRADADRYNRSDMLYVATAGEEGKKPSELSKLYPYAGVVTMRSDWGDVAPYEDVRYLMLHGVHKGSHGHRDLNSVIVYAYGRELLTDPGPYIYGSPKHALLVESPAHNLMTIDGENQGITTRPEFYNWSTTPVADYLSSLAIYEAGDHIRDVTYIRSNGDQALDYWLVSDKAVGTGTHLLEQRWHFVPGQISLNESTLVARTMFDEKGNLAVLQIDPSRLQVKQTEQDTWRYEGTAADPSKLPTVIYSAKTALPAAVHTVLLPFQGHKMPDFAVESLGASADGMDSAFKVTQGPVTDVFAYQRSASQKTLASEGISFDGDRLFVRKTNGKLRSAFLVNGTSLTVDGEQIIQASKPVMWVSVSLDDSGIQAHADSEDSGLTFPAFESGKVNLTSVDTRKSLDPAGIKEKK